MPVPGGGGNGGVEGSGGGVGGGGVLAHCLGGGVGGIIGEFVTVEWNSVGCGVLAVADGWGVAAVELVMQFRISVRDLVISLAALIRPGKKKELSLHKCLLSTFIS